MLNLSNGEQFFYRHEATEPWNQVLSEDTCCTSVRFTVTTFIMNAKHIRRTELNPIFTAIKAQSHGDGYFCEYSN